MNRWSLNRFQSKNMSLQLHWKTPSPHVLSDFFSQRQLREKKCYCARMINVHKNMERFLAIHSPLEHPTIIQPRAFLERSWLCPGYRFRFPERAKLTSLQSCLIRLREQHSPLLSTYRRWSGRCEMASLASKCWVCEMSGCFKPNDTFNLS